MSNKESGYVYILTPSPSGCLHTCKSPSFREDWMKIGKSSRPVDDGRKKVISRTDPMIREKFRITFGSIKH